MLDLHPIHDITGRKCAGNIHPCAACTACHSLHKTSAQAAYWMIPVWGPWFATSTHCTLHLFQRWLIHVDRQPFASLHMHSLNNDGHAHSDARAACKTSTVHTLDTHLLPHSGPQPQNFSHQFPLFRHGQPAWHTLLAPPAVHE